MDVKKFLSCFSIEDAEVLNIQYYDNTLIIEIKNELYRYAVGNGFRDEEERICKLTYEFNNVIIKSNNMDFNYIEFTSFDNDVIFKTNNGEFRFMFSEVVLK